MLDKLSSIEARYDELGRLMADPSVVQDYEKVALMGGKTSELRMLLDGFRYNKTPYLAGGNERLGVLPVLGETYRAG